LLLVIGIIQFVWTLIDFNAVTISNDGYQILWLLNYVALSILGFLLGISIIKIIVKSVNKICHS
jgi:hypothetical protein